MTFNQRERNELDKHITGNYGEDQLKEKPKLPAPVEIRKKYTELAKYFIPDDVGLQDALTDTIQGAVESFMQEFTESEKLLEEEQEKE